MRKRLSILACIACLIAGLWAFYGSAHRQSRGGQQAPLFSVRRYDPYGTAALLDLLRLRAPHVRTLQRSRPGRADSGTLIQVLPVPREHTPFARPRLDPQKLKAWIARGNTVIQCTAARTELMEACGVPRPSSSAPPTATPAPPAKKTPGVPIPPAPPPARQEPARQVQNWGPIQEHMIKGKPPSDLPGEPVLATWIAPGPQGPGDPAPVTQPIRLHAPMALSDEPSALWEPLAAAPGIGAVVGRQRVGTGRLIVIASPTPLLNGELDEGGNLDMILAFVGSDPVLIDEWSHGIGHGGTVIGLIRTLGLTPVLLQIAFVAVLYTWSTRGHRRFDMPSPPARRSVAEQVVTLGHLYGQALGPVEMNRRVVDLVRNRIASVLRCGPSQIEQTLGAPGPRPRISPGTVADLRALLAAADALATEAPGPFCPQCGHNLRGTDRATCPECGAGIEAAMLRAIRATIHLGPGKPEGRDSGGHSGGHSGGAEREAARLITASHELVRELKRERSRV